jgi:hypothetical protein
MAIPAANRRPEAPWDAAEMAGARQARQEEPRLPAR